MRYFTFREWSDIVFHSRTVVFILLITWVHPCTQSRRRIDSLEIWFMTMLNLRVAARSVLCLPTTEGWSLHLVPHPCPGPALNPCPQFLLGKKSAGRDIFNYAPISNVVMVWAVGVVAQQVRWCVGMPALHSTVSPSPTSDPASC